MQLFEKREKWLTTFTTKNVIDDDVDIQLGRALVWREIILLDTKKKNK